MLVNIEEIRPEGLVIDRPVTLESLTASLGSDGHATGFRAASGFELHAQLHKVSGGVLLEGRFRAPVTAPCKRCLADVQVTLPVEFTLNLVPKSRVRDDAGGPDGDDDEHAQKAGSFVLDSANEELFDGRTIDLDPIVREQILLALPMDVVCREDCKGLCATCGKDLNEGPCACAPREGDPRFAALKNIKIN